MKEMFEAFLHANLRVSEMIAVFLGIAVIAHLIALTILPIIKNEKIRALEPRLFVNLVLIWTLCLLFAFGNYLTNIDR